MSKSDEYRANADECQKMARLATNPGERATWPEMALRMIQKVDPSASDKFDAAEKAKGTNQEHPRGEHWAVGKAP